MKTITGWLAKAGLKTTVGKWAWGAAGMALLTLSASLMGSCTKLSESRNALKLARLAYENQAEKITRLEATVATFKCESGWREEVRPDGTTIRTCAGIYGGSTTSTVYVDRWHTPVFQETKCPRYPISVLVGGATDAKKTAGWQLGGEYELNNWVSVYAGGGKYGPGMLLQGGAAIRLPVFAR